MSRRNRLLVITEKDSDFLRLIRTVEPEAAVWNPSGEWPGTLDGFDSIALLGGCSDEPLLLAPGKRKEIERQLSKGKRVFAEFVASIGHVYFAPPQSTRFERLVYCSANGELAGLETGALLDDQCGSRIRPHSIACRHNTPILQYVKVHAHDRITLGEAHLADVSDRALWFDDPDNLLVCSFRFCNFIRSRFAPREGAVKLAEFLMSWLFGETVRLPSLTFAYESGTGIKPDLPLRERVRASAEKAMAWFERSGMLIDEGWGGLLEGFGTEIDPEGRQRISRILRADCIGEAGMAYFFHGLLASDERSLTISDRLADFVFDGYFCDEPGPFYGMVRWTNEAWGICYQDDVARAMMGQLLKCLVSGADGKLDKCRAALHFLVKTTGTDGTRVFRTDNIRLDETAFEKLRNEPGGLPSAHYNAYYYAALLLGYKLTGDNAFLETALKGMRTIMNAYPHTKREQSETQEYCRLILPLSCLYAVTREPEHREWLYRVAGDLERFRHPSGAYLEWDEGYQAAMRHEIGTGESSLVANNGDPVADLLYSNNWLPLGWVFAYLATDDPVFMERWESTAEFMVRAQLLSEDPRLDGAWARAYDVERMEVFGSPADVGWGPWAIESGWTVAEIAAGLMAGLMTERLRGIFH